MAEGVLDYIVMGVFWLLAIFSFLIGVEQMIKIIVGNYILTALIVALSNAIELFNTRLLLTPTNAFFGISFERRAGFVSSGETTLLLLLYCVILVLIFQRSNIAITVSGSYLTQQWIMVLLIPLTIFSVIFGLEAAIFGANLFSTDALMKAAYTVTGSPFFYNFVVMTPVWMFAHALVTLFLTTNLHLQYSQRTFGEEE